MPQADAWRRDWAANPAFRHVWRAMTAAWGAASLLDTAARVVLAYTLPVDLVPVAGTALLLMLIAVVQGSKAYAGRRLTPPPGPGDADPSEVTTPDAAGRGGGEPGRAPSRLPVANRHRTRTPALTCWTDDSRCQRNYSALSVDGAVFYKRGRT